MAARKAWVDQFFNSKSAGYSRLFFFTSVSGQLHGVTTAALLMEIGGDHVVNGPRDLNRVVDTYAGTTNAAHRAVQQLCWRVTVPARRQAAHHARSADLAVLDQQQCFRHALRHCPAFHPPSLL